MRRAEFLDASCLDPLLLSLLHAQLDPFLAGDRLPWQWRLQERVVLAHASLLSSDLVDESALEIQRQRHEPGQQSGQHDDVVAIEAWNAQQRARETRLLDASLLGVPPCPTRHPIDGDEHA
ncbi:MAG: hypothetical protein IT459_06145 [Planctomycetes bacterium]|nr:hypothetical protein [Planctomycetota bacterium]